MKNDFSIYENYNFLELKPIPYNILAFSGNEDKTVTQEEILAWSAYIKGQFQHILFPGKHFFIKYHQKKILKIINQIGEKHI